MNYKTDKFAQCVGCGYCCLKAPCAVSVKIFGVTSLCPALSWRDYRNRYVCSIFKLAVSQFSDEGCSSSLNSWRKTKKIHRREKQELEAKKVKPVVAVENRGLLYEMIVDEKKSFTTIAKTLKCSISHVQHFAEEMKIPVIENKDRVHDAKLKRWKKKGLTKDNLNKLYHQERKTLIEIASITDSGKDVVIKAMKEFGIKRRHRMAFHGVNTSVYAPENEIKWIEEIAMRENKSQSDIIREGLQLVIQKYAQA